MAFEVELDTMEALETVAAGNEGATGGADMSALMTMMQNLVQDQKKVLDQIKNSEEKQNTVLEQMEEQKNVQNTVLDQIGQVKCKQKNIALELTKSLDMKLEALEKSNRQQLANVYEKVDNVREEVMAKVENANFDVNGKFEQVHNNVENIRDQMTTIQNTIEIQVKKHMATFIGQNGSSGLTALDCSGKAKMKTPIFDGNTSWNAFQIQFEASANNNGWNQHDKATVLLLALKAEAADIIQTIPQDLRNSYDHIKNILERKYGNSHKADIYKIELQSRQQKHGESLQLLASDIERLAHHAYPAEIPNYLERTKINAFINSVADLEIKKALVLDRKANFADTLSYALKYEAAQVTKIDDDSSEKIMRLFGIFSK